MKTLDLRCIVLLSLLIANLSIVEAQAAVTVRPSARSEFNRQRTGGSISGTVTTPTGESPATAVVTLLNAQGAVLRRTETDADGRFGFSNLPVGSYEVSITSSGFDERRAAVSVTENGNVELNVVVEVGDLRDEVTVTAETGQVSDIDRIAQQVNVIGERAIEQRTTTTLAQIAEEEPGVALQRTSPSIGAVVVRGLTEVGVYIDGVRYTTATQRGGINTFFNLNEPSNLRSVEILRGTSSAQYNTESVGGIVQLVSRVPAFGDEQTETHGEFKTSFTSADFSFGSNALVTYGSRRFGALLNFAFRRANTLRTGKGIDSHAAVTRFLGIPSNVFGTRLTDTAFSQYGGLIKINYAPTDTQQLILHYHRGQQDGASRYDQLLGGDGNLIADLRNLQQDFFYARYVKQEIGFFDSGALTFMFSNQREERVNQSGQGNPLAAISSDTERTGVVGFTFNLGKQFARNSLLTGFDFYRDKVVAPSFSFDPRTTSVTPARGRVPNGARYLLAGLFLQDAYEILPNRLRLTGAARYNVASYRVREDNAPVVGGRALFQDDSLRVSDFSGRVGGVLTIIEGLNASFNYSRGFRPPNISDLGSTGLVGVGFQVSGNELAGLGASIGTTADEMAVSTGIGVTALNSQTSDNFDLGINFRHHRLRAAATGFVIDYNNAITRQTLILPNGAVGTRLGSESIERQLSTGAVFVAASPNPVLVQVNFGAARIAGIETEFDLRLTKTLTLNGNYTFVRASDRETGAPPNLGGAGIPPPLGFLGLSYAPASNRYTVEAYTTLAGRQTRLSSLDLADRRTGALRSRTNIANFFNRGARVRGLISTGADNLANTADDVLLVTNETLAQVQARVLGAQTSAPLYSEIPGFGIFGVRGEVQLSECSELGFDFENIADKNYRQPGWGIDGAGRSVTLRYKYSF